MPKAYSYLRFSTPDQLEGDSLRRQQEGAKAYAEAHKLDLDENLTFQDLGVSAYTGRNRDAALGAFISAVEDGRISKGSYLLVESLDRLSRDQTLIALGQLQEIVSAGITVVTLSDGREYTRENLSDTPNLMYSIILMSTAHEESVKKSQRLGAAWKNKKERARTGEHKLSGRAPAWLTLNQSTGTFDIIPERVDMLKRIFAMTLEGHGAHTSHAF